MLFRSNVISMGNGSGTDFTGTITQSYNMSSDGSAAGTGSLINKTAANQFVSLTGGSENFHLKAGADAINTGTDLSASGVTTDIDGDTRPISTGWEIGADETTASATGVRQPRPSGSGQYPAIY